MEPKKLFYITWIFGVLSVGAFLIIVIVTLFNLGNLGIHPVLGFFIACIPALFYFAFVFLVLSKKDRRDIDLYGWELKRGFLLSVNAEFDLVEGEKIIFPMTACYVIGRTLLSYNELACDVIVTNKRIMIGFVTNVFIFQRETFSEGSYWHPDVKTIPSRLSDLFGGNAKIKNIEYGVDEELGQYVKIRPERYEILGGSFKVFHPQARRIFDMFSKSLK